MGINAFHKAGGAGLYYGDIPFVKRQDTGYVEDGFKDPTANRGQSQAEILSQTWIDADRRMIATSTGILRDQLHVHEGRFTGLIEPLLRVHRVIPIQRLAFVRHFETLLRGSTRHSTYALMSKPITTGNAQYH
ncbi:hypothetical protein D3C76_1123690 [compost metagenome]